MFGVLEFCEDSDDRLAKVRAVERRRSAGPTASPGRLPSDCGPPPTLRRRFPAGRSRPRRRDIPHRPQATDPGQPHVRLSLCTISSTGNKSCGWRSANTSITTTLQVSGRSAILRLSSRIMSSSSRAVRAATWRCSASPATNQSRNVPARRSVSSDNLLPSRLGAFPPSPWHRKGRRRLPPPPRVGHFPPGPPRPATDSPPVRSAAARVARRPSRARN